MRALPPAVAAWTALSPLAPRPLFEGQPRIVLTLAALKQQKHEIVHRHALSDNLKGGIQVLTTLLPLAALWYGVVVSAGVSHWLTIGVVALMVLFLVRVFALMHECGHGSLFRSARANAAAGFVLGVVSGMPAYVWSQHHQHHHSTNGNWDRYRGPMNIIPLEQYAAMSVHQRRRYRYLRSVWLAPFFGLFYLIVNPRVTWLRGSVGLLWHIVRRKFEQPRVSMRIHARDYTTPCWASARELRHMCWNNLVLLTLWGMMAWAVGPLLFLVCYTVSLSLAGGVGILLFTVQHNFEHSYASRDQDWDYHAAVLAGTSFLELPRWLNWFTANIAYHHIHHLSAQIPNYRLVACHNENQELFSSVRRIKLSQIPGALKYILWDMRARRIVSVAEYQPTVVR